MLGASSMLGAFSLARGLTFGQARIRTFSFGEDADSLILQSARYCNFNNAAGTTIHRSLMSVMLNAQLSDFEGRWSLSPLPLEVDVRQVKSASHTTNASC